MRELRAHGAAACLFVAVALVWSFPLALHLSTHLAGESLGDNSSFLWNIWWMRKALASGDSFFQTSYLFAPVGSDLVLHTHTALSALIGATLLRPVQVTTALNIILISTLALNAFVAYLAAWDITRDHVASMIGGIVFGCSPYLAAHLGGHFNLTSGWVLPLFALLLSRALEYPSAWRAAAAGIVLGITVFVDYYYVVYEAVLLLAMVAAAATTWSVRRGRSTLRSPVLWTVAALVAIDLFVIALVASGTGFDVPLGRFRVSINEVFNPLQILWALIAIGVVVYARPHVAVASNASALRAPLRALLVVGATALVIAAPIAWKGIQLLASSQYVSQRYFWRSGPAGIDVATMFMGNPFNGVWGGWVRHLYASLGIDAVESVAWPGLASLSLAAFAVRRQPTNHHVVRWCSIGAVFACWALGAHVHAFGRNTGMVTPAAIVRFIPIASNARIPARAMVLVYLALAMLSAIAVKAIRQRNGGARLVALLAALLAIDFLAAPIPTVPIACPAIYDTLRDRPEQGALVELPLGFGDGFGALTPVENRVTLACQTVHERPLVGGFVARLSPRVTAAYRSDALLAALLALSGASGEFARVTVPDRETARQRLSNDHISFVLLDRTLASRELMDYVDRVLPLRLVTTAGDRSLYVVDR